MPFVLDTSVAACWAFEDEDHPLADAALLRIRKDEAVVPSLWWFEVRNAMIINERRQRLTVTDTFQFLQGLSRLPVRVDREPDEEQVLSLARSHRLSVYDAAYLELALREGAALATLDGALAEAARREGVPLVGNRAGV